VVEMCDATLLETIGEPASGTWARRRFDRQGRGQSRGCTVPWTQASSTGRGSSLLRTRFARARDAGRVAEPGTSTAGVSRGGPARSLASRPLAGLRSVSPALPARGHELRGLLRVGGDLVEQRPVLLF
jgi:hypothetical protein